MVKDKINIAQNEQYDLDNPVHDEKEIPVFFKSIPRMANILRCLSQGIDSITDIAKECQLHKSTVYRLLKASEQAQLTSRDPFRHKYFLGPLISEIASNPHVPHERLVSCAIKEMRQVAEYSMESVGLHILTGFHNMFLIHEIPSTYDLQVVAKNKIHSALHAGATSKVLLFQLSDATLNRILEKLDFSPITPQSITTKETLMKEVKMSRQQGYAVDFSEQLEGVMCLSVPIANYVQPAALSILAPEQRFKPKMDDCIKQLLATAAHIEKNLDRILTSPRD